MKVIKLAIIAALIIPAGLALAQSCRTPQSAGSNLF